MSGLTVSRLAEIPDALRIARCRSLPNLGPRLLFFSGGSALNDIAHSLKGYTHNSRHLITPFDSGGSSQVLRAAFNMPAVGDLRSRLMALADESDLGQPDIFRLFTHRLPANAEAAVLRAEARAILTGEHPLICAVSQPMRQLIQTQLRSFAEAMPADFDFRKASVGNLILAGGYLANDRALEPVLFLMSKMVAVQGTVRSIVDANLQIGAELADGTIIIGQSKLTGKEMPPLTQSIRRLFLAEGDAEVTPERVKLPERNLRLIETADLICYPPGSLYSSVIANLLPLGVGAAIARRTVPKVYLPSLGPDPECPGLGLVDQVEALLEQLRRDAGGDCPADRLLQFVLCDGDSFAAADARELGRRHGIVCMAQTLASEANPTRYDPRRVCDSLVSLT
ncbi:GAK system CofD-like protein [Tropicimonas isoalkanivorans]|uniref:CofD-related protein, GAK system n=1 Tax=Tropicimonas isoalkanivorans TaxID=441112 RepID=A0A1I1PHG7_9RHOB|nr:GAK system CofD-like protein [Tropicimonas isoalkanivorans]SFD09247.1 CofD-related protein, GAK system [Tropicimonas isoalkanivorans]